MVAVFFEFVLVPVSEKRRVVDLTRLIRKKKCQMPGQQIEDFHASCSFESNLVYVWIENILFEPSSTSDIVFFEYAD